MSRDQRNENTQLDQASLNRLWARLILASLYRQGVRHFCLAPGSRSTPLILEVALLAKEYPTVCLHKHFDERGLGFLALGLAKTTNVAVAVIVTSGTAVANLLPAVVESGLTREKLILLTADRPQELIQCGANQAILQPNIFNAHVASHCSLPSPTEKVSAKWLLATLGEHLSIQQKVSGSIHINCPYPEPLYGGLNSEQQAAIANYMQPIKNYLAENKPYLPLTAAVECDFSDLLALWLALQNKKGMIVLGNIKSQDKGAVCHFAKQLGWPVLADLQAGVTLGYMAFDLWLQNKACLQLLKKCEFILQFGARLVSKRLGLFLTSFTGDYWLVDENVNRLDPYHLAAQRIQISPKKWVSFFISHCIFNPWALELKKASQATLALVSQLMQKRSLSELAIANDFCNWIADNSALFIGNSLVIRLLDMVATLPDCAVFSNRGASGIDGLLATAIGVQRGIQKPMLCLLGDVSALYDLNSLALLTECQQPFILLVMNNSGCGIFDLLPVPDDEHKQAFYRMPHQFDFSHAAAMFELNYFAPKTLLEAKSICLNMQKEIPEKSNATLIELMVPAGEARQNLQHLFAAISDAKLL